MSLPDYLPLAQEGGFYDLGRSLQTQGPEMLEYVGDPAHLAAFGSSGLAALAVGIAGIRLTGPTRSFVHRHLFREPGEVVLGYRKGALLTSHPVYAALEDLLMHMRVVAATGGGKSSFLEFLAYQYLLQDITVFAIELIGDLRDKLLAQAFALRKRIFHFDPSVPGAMKYNPLAGPTESVAERAVYTFEAAAESGKEQFFRNFNGMVLRYFVKAISLWAHHEGGEPTLADLRRFCSDRTFRNRVVLGVGRSKEAGANAKGDAKGAGDKKSRLTVNAPYIDPDTRMWFEHKYLGEFTSRQREEFTAGLTAIVEKLLATSMVREALDPRPGEPVLRFDKETMASGGLVLPCIPVGIVGQSVGKILSTWMLMDFTQSMQARIKGGYPVAAFYDEVHRMLGHQSTDLADEFANFLTGARHLHVACHLAYQSPSLIPEYLAAVIDTNTRTSLVAGGQSYADAMAAVRNMGYSQEKVRDRRRTHKGMMGGPGTYSVGEREMEQPEVSEEELRYISRGQWYLHQTKGGDLQKPILITAGRAPKLQTPFKVQQVVPEGDLEKVVEILKPDPVMA